MQMRKNCNHPDLITGGYDGSTTLPSIELLLRQCGKLQFLDRLYKKLKKRGHKILIFSQVIYYKIINITFKIKYLDDKDVRYIRRLF